MVFLFLLYCNNFKVYKVELCFFQAENTFILSLDGDVDFKPDAVRLLVDRLKKNKKVGAACGRIHPIGSGIHLHVFVCAYSWVLFNRKIYLLFNS